MSATVALPLPEREDAGDDWLVDARGVGHHFGRHAALEGVDVTLARGRVTGLIGPNGAGKSTLLAILAGHVRPRSGGVAWAGGRAGGRLRGWLSMLPQGAPLAPTETPRRFLAYMARLQHAGDPQRAASETLAAVGLSARADVRLRALSEGERKLVAIAQAFLGEPQVILLDEPTSALDPWGRQRLRGLIRARRDAGAAVMMASHNLAETEQLCDEVVVLAGGRVRSEGALSSLTRAPDEVRFEIGAAGAPPIAALEAALHGARVTFDAESRALTVRGLALDATVEQMVASTFRLLVAAGAEVRRVTCGQSLERALTDLLPVEPRDRQDLDRGLPNEHR